MLFKIFSKVKDSVFISVPQLFEAGFDKFFDKIIYITADESIRLKRLMLRNNLTLEEAQIRINSQKEDEKRNFSDFVIENNGDLESLKKSVENVIFLIHK